MGRCRERAKLAAYNIPTTHQGRDETMGDITPSNGAIDSNKDLWDQFLKALKGTQTQSAYANRPGQEATISDETSPPVEPNPVNEAEPVDNNKAVDAAWEDANEPNNSTPSKHGSTTVADEEVKATGNDQIFIAGLEDGNQLNNNIPSEHGSTATDEEDDIVINFDNDNISEPKEEVARSPKSKGKQPASYESADSPYANNNASSDQHVTFDVEVDGKQISSQTSRFSEIDGKALQRLDSPPASYSADFEDQHLVPAPLFGSTEAVGAAPSEQDSEISDEVTYHPDRFNMARKRKTEKSKALVLVKAPFNKANGGGRPNGPATPQAETIILKELQAAELAEVGRRALGIVEEEKIKTDKALTLARHGDGNNPESDIGKHLRSFVTDIPSTKLIGYHDTSNPANMQVARIVHNTSVDQGVDNSKRPWANYRLYRLDKHGFFNDDGRILSGEEREKWEAPWTNYYKDAPLHDEEDPDCYQREPNNRMTAMDGLPLSYSPVLDEFGKPTNWQNIFGNPGAELLVPHLIDKNSPQFLLFLRNWLETGCIGLPEPVITNRSSFYDGTAHPDGISAMFMPEIEDVVAFLDLNDPRNAEHAHETSAGFIHNTNVRKAKEAAIKEEEKRQTQMEYRSLMVLEPEQNPNVPRANIFLRPVENGDINGLTALYNIYVKNTVRTLERQEITDQDMLDRKNECSRENLPFIVAIERRVEGRSHTQAVVGFASATDFFGSHTAGNHTAELDLFVHPDRCRLGIANCLIDKLLEVCDRTFVPKKGYWFNANYGGHAAYSPGGNRELARLIFIIHFAESDKSEYLWLKDWLESRFMFEEQALLKGVAYKRDRVINSSYLVRNTGRHLQDAVNTNF
ncbi:hypothetical protein FQN54_000229 [Arachnomyces sp. PD_36]|nr:hypothetical protein FQN54_000229 [Arachnomyces sp. PD_36]